MDNYKKIIKSRRNRNIILRMLFWIPSKIMLKIQYKIKLKRKLELKKPQRFTEKVQLYKFKYKDPLMKKCVDKYDVRDYIASKGLENILVKNYGVYNNGSEINIKELPQKFVVKTTTGGGGNNVLIYKDKKDFNIKQIKRKIGNSKIKVSKFDGGREWAYSGLKPRIIIEELLETSKDLNSSIQDYKFFCFNGTPTHLVVDNDRYIDHKRNFYDVNWNFLNIESDKPQLGDLLKKPKNYNKMIEIAKLLSQDFPFVRVDLYNVDGVIKFGELTFYPWSGYVQFYPDNFDFILGDLFKYF